MNLIGKIIISLVVTGIVFGAAQLVPGLPLLPLLLAATLGTSLLTSFPVGGNPAAASRATPAAVSSNKGSSKDSAKTNTKASAKSSSKQAAPKSKPTKEAPRQETAKPASGPREEGEVKWFNVSKGFGFITKDDGEEIFVHFRSIRGEGRRGLKDGQRVSFVHADSDKGPQAEDVEAL